MMLIITGKKTVTAKDQKGKGKTKDQTVTTAAASPKIWRLLRTNTSAVYLHVLVIKTDPYTNVRLLNSNPDGKYSVQEHLLQ